MKRGMGYGSVAALLLGALQAPAIAGAQPSPAPPAAAPTAAAAAAAVPDLMSPPPVPESAKRPGDDKLSCEELKAEGTRQQQMALAATDEIDKVEVSMAPVRAATGLGVGAALAQTVAGALGGSIAGAVTGAATDTAVKAAGLAAREKVFSDLRSKQDAIQKRSNEAMDRSIHLFTLYQSKCL